MNIGNKILRKFIFETKFKNKVSFSECEKLIQHYKKQNENNKIYGEVAKEIKQNGYMKTRVKYLATNDLKRFSILEFFNTVSPKKLGFLR